MTAFLADVAPARSGLALGVVLSLGCLCLILVAAVVIVVLLVRRSRSRRPPTPPPPAGGAPPGPRPR